MRILLMFDLPTCSKQGKKAYSEFRKFLINDGYYMEQYSVYTREILGRDSMETHLERLKKNLPPIGSVTVICLTEKQYESRMVLLKPPACLTEQSGFGAQLTLSF